MNDFTKKLLLSLALIFILFFSFGRVASAQSSYELFWPIVAGRTVEDPLYWLKALKEKLRGALILSDAKKAEYSLFLSEKRLVEFENLVAVKKDDKSAEKTFAELRDNQLKVMDSLAKAQTQGVDVGYVKQRILGSFSNQVLILKGLEANLPGGLKDLVSKMITSLDSDINKLHL